MRIFDIFFFTLSLFFGRILSRWENEAWIASSNIQFSTRERGWKNDILRVMKNIATFEIVEPSEVLSTFWRFTSR